MNKLIVKVDEWSQKHHPDWIDVLRMVTGLLIIAMAIVFIGGTVAVHAPKAILYIVVTVLILGGIMVMVGLRTRTITLVLMPAVVATLAFSLIDLEGIFLASEMLFSLVILFLLAIFFIEGSGRISVDEFIRNSYKSEDPR